MKKILLILLLIPCVVLSQTNKELAKKKIDEAIELMDNGKISESLLLLDECEKLDPDSYTYSYEKAYAYVLEKKYDKAIEQLKRSRKFKKYNFEVDLLLANTYDYAGQSDKALEVYDEGIKKYPSVPHFEFEKGNCFLIKKDYDKAISHYLNAIKIDPNYPSAYYRLAYLLVNSNDKLSGLVYGEIFVNLERTTKRTLEISELMYNVYKENITFKTDGAKIDFCDVIITDTDLQKGKLKMPFCHYFGYNFILATFGKTEVTPSSLSSMREGFLELYMKNSYKDCPNVLVSYLDKVKKAGFLDTYNRYIFQAGYEKEFEEWYGANKEKFDKFVEWYTKEANVIHVEKETLFLMD